MSKRLMSRAVSVVAILIIIYPSPALAGKAWRNFKRAMNPFHWAGQGLGSGIPTEFEAQAEIGIRNIDELKRLVNSFNRGNIKTISHLGNEYEKSLSSSYRVIGSLLGGVDQSTKYRLQQIDQLLEERISQVSAELQLVSNELDQMLDARIGQVDQALEDRIRQTRDELQIVLSHLDQMLADRINQFDQVLETRIAQITRNLQTILDEVDQILENRIDQLDQAFKERISQISRELQIVLNDVNRTLDEVDQMLENRIRQVDEAFEARFNQLDESSKEIISLLMKEIEEQTKLISIEIERVSKVIIDDSTDAAIEITDNLSDEAQETIEVATQNIQMILEDTSKEVQIIIEKVRDGRIAVIKTAEGAAIYIVNRTADLILAVSASIIGMIFLFVSSYGWGKAILQHELPEKRVIRGLVISLMGMNFVASFAPFTFLMPNVRAQVLLPFSENLNEVLSLSSSNINRPEWIREPELLNELNESVVEAELSPHQPESAPITRENIEEILDDLNSAFSSAFESGPEIITQKSAVSPITQEEAEELIAKWQKAKKRIFAPPFDKDLLDQVTTGKLKEGITQSGGIIDLQKQDNEYYEYTYQSVDEVEELNFEKGQVIVSAIVSESRTKYQDSEALEKVTETQRFRYKLQQNDGIWKIAFQKPLDIISREVETRQISEEEAEQSIIRWLEAKPEIFGTSPNLNLAAEVTVDDKYNAIKNQLIRQEKENIYLEFEHPELHSIEKIDQENNTVIVKLSESTKEKRNSSNIDDINTFKHTRLVEYRLKFSKGVWKIANEKTLETLEVTNESNDASMTIKTVEELISQWFENKKNIFSHPYSLELAADITTGKQYKRIKEGVLWLKNNNAYYKYDSQKFIEVKSFKFDGNEISAIVVLNELYTLYKNGKVDFVSSNIEDLEYIYKFKYIDGEWKISESREIQE